MTEEKAEIPGDKLIMWIFFLVFSMSFWNEGKNKKHSDVSLLFFCVSKTEILNKGGYGNSNVFFWKRQMTLRVKLITQ